MTMAILSTHLARFLMIANFFLGLVVGFDPQPMQDFCVADFNSPYAASAPGALPCKPVKNVSADDFHHSGLKIRGNSSNSFKIGLTSFSVNEVPGFNTLGFSLVRLDVEAGAVFPTHTHQRASELHIVLEGCLGVGFVSSGSGNYTLYEKKVKAGELFIVPMGLYHYQKNCWDGHTSSYSVFNSQNFGLNTVNHAVFGSTPKMDSAYLESAFKLNEKTIKGLLAETWA